jgi:hypothetical protein
MLNRERRTGESVQSQLSVSERMRINLPEDF